MGRVYKQDHIIVYPFRFISLKQSFTCPPTSPQSPTKPFQLPTSTSYKMCGYDKVTVVCIDCDKTLEVSWKLKKVCPYFTLCLQFDKLRPRRRRAVYRITNFIRCGCDDEDKQESPTKFWKDRLSSYKPERHSEHNWMLIDAGLGKKWWRDRHEPENGLQASSGSSTEGPDTKGPAVGK
jgi:hypothetical protein